MLFHFPAIVISWRELARRTIREIAEDNCLGLAAQLAFYFLLALFPALLVLVTLLAYMPVEHAMDALLDALSTVAPVEVLEVVRGEMHDVAAEGSAGLLTLGILGAIWSSSAATMAIISTLNRAYDITDRRPWWHQRLTAILLTVALACVVLAIQALLLIGSAAAHAVGAALGSPAFESLWSAARWPALFLLVVLAIDLVYYVAPDAETEWVWLSPGSVVATALWLAASWGFKWYVRNLSDFSATYGALGGFVVLMLWLYLSGLAILVGGELNAEIDRASAYRDQMSDRRGRRAKIGAAAKRAQEEEVRRIG
jgi:membrane protein